MDQIGFPLSIASNVIDSIHITGKEKHLMKLRNILTWAAIAALVLVSPAFAGDEGESEDGSYFITVEGALTAASGPGGLYTLVGESDDGPVGTFRSVDLDESFAPRLSFGWKMGDGWWSVSWSQWDDDSTDMATGVDPIYVWDTLYHADEAFDYYEGTAEGFRGVDASTIDLAYSRKIFSNDKFSGRWTFGLRQASLDHNLDAVYTYDDGEGIEIHEVGLTSEASGFGLFGGVNGSYNLSKKWFVTGGFQYAFLSGEVDASTFMMYEDIEDFEIDADVNSSEDRMFSMFGASTSLVWHPTEPLYFWVGYELTQWNDVVDTMLFPDDVSEGFAQTDTTSISFDGFVFGAGWVF